MFIYCAYPPSLAHSTTPHPTDALTYSSKQHESSSSNNVTIPFSHRALEAYSKITYGQVVEEIQSMQKEYPGFLQVGREGGDDREGGREGGVLVAHYLNSHLPSLLFISFF